MIEVDIQVAAEGWQALPFDPAAAARRAIAALAGTAAADGARAEGAISLALSDDAHVRTLNRTHRGVDTPTNVLAFPAPPAIRPAGAAPFLGDVVLAFETVKREAEARNLPIANHMSHLIVHGALHLLGYDHQHDGDAARMEAEETAILARLGIPDPYLIHSAEEAHPAPDG